LLPGKNKGKVSNYKPIREEKPMRQIDSFYTYIAVRKAIADILNKEGYDVTKCFRIIEPELGNAFNAIKQQGSELMSHGEVKKEKDDRQMHMWEYNGQEIVRCHN
jgi:hypothetical protein